MGIPRGFLSTPLFRRFPKIHPGNESQNVQYETPGSGRDTFSKLERTSRIPHWVTPPVVKIIIPIFNQSQFLKSSIISVLEQDYKNLSITILDDGSTEPVKEIIDTFASDPRVSILSQTNQGLPESLARLSNVAYHEIPPAEFITWHSGDNEYEKNAISSLSSCLTANPDLSFCYSNVKLIDESGLFFEHSKYREIDQCSENTSQLLLDYPVHTLSSFNDNFINACFLSRLELDRLVPPYKKEDNGYEDYKHWLFLHLLAPGTHIGSRESLYRYRLHRESMTSTIPNHSLRERQSQMVRKSMIAQSMLHGEIPVTVNLQRDACSLDIETSRTVVKDHTIPDSLIKHLSGYTLKLATFDSLLHTSHKIILGTFPMQIQSSTSPGFLPASFVLPSFLLRARDRNLGAFENHGFQNGTLAVFTPAKPGHYSDGIIEIILRYPNTGIMLIAQSSEEREVADQIFLNSTCAENIRIIDTRQSEGTDSIANPALLHALGSVDAILSLSTFDPYFNSKNNQNEYHPIFDQIDFCAETALAAAVKRPLLAPINLHPKTKSPSRTHPHIYPWHKELELPELSGLKTELHDCSCDAVLRSFDKHTRVKQIASKILFDWLDL
jgi:glycosyltransferase involved in cell wall biosynthesis